MPEYCFTCNGAHGPDEACGRERPGVQGPRRDDLVDDAEDTPRFGPIFTATYESDCESCDEGIVAGEDTRADGRGGWIHADDQCERVARG